MRSIRQRLTTSTAQRLRTPPKVVDPHYRTDEHRVWAAEVMRRARYQCQAPGCRKGRPDHRLYADHIVELKDGGAAFDPANGQALCASHHTAKTMAARAARR